MPRGKDASQHAYELDRVSPDHPVYIRSIWGYWRPTLPLVSVANSLALGGRGHRTRNGAAGPDRRDREGS